MLHPHFFKILITDVLANDINETINIMLENFSHFSLGIFWCDVHDVDIFALSCSHLLPCNHWLLQPLLKLHQFLLSLSFIFLLPFLDQFVHLRLGQHGSNIHHAVARIAIVVPEALPGHEFVVGLRIVLSGVDTIVSSRWWTVSIWPLACLCWLTHF